MEAAARAVRQSRPRRRLNRQAVEQPVVTVSTEITAVAIADSSATAQPAPARAAGPSAGAIFRITPDGVSDLVWDLREDSPYDIAFEPDAPSSSPLATKARSIVCLATRSSRR